MLITPSRIENVIRQQFNGVLEAQNTEDVLPQLMTALHESQSIGNMERAVVVLRQLASDGTMVVKHTSTRPVRFTLIATPTALAAKRHTRPSKDALIAALFKRIEVLEALLANKE